MKLLLPCFIQDLLDAAHELTAVMSKTLNLDFTCGNDDFKDVKDLKAARDRLCRALDRFRSPA